MLGSQDEATVTCIACGATVERSNAREYDKHGDRWDRDGKEFEYFCKPCDRDRDRQPRRGLEDLLVDCEAGDVPDEEFIAAYLSQVHEEATRDGEER